MHACERAYVRACALVKKANSGSALHESLQQSKRGNASRMGCWWIVKSVIGAFRFVPIPFSAEEDYCLLFMCVRARACVRASVCVWHRRTDAPT